MKKKLFCSFSFLFLILASRTGFASWSPDLENRPSNAITEQSTAKQSGRVDIQELIEKLRILGQLSESEQAETLITATQIIIIPTLQKAKIVNQNVSKINLETSPSGSAIFDTEAGPSLVIGITYRDGHTVPLGILLPKPPEN